MKLTVTIRNAETPLPPDRVLAEAAARGVEVAVRRHLRRKNSSSSRREGFPKSNYWADAAETVSVASVSGSHATVEVAKEGAALHYHGGVVLPKKKALAIPLDPAVAAIWPSEHAGYATGGSGDDGATAPIWPKGSNHGFIKDTETGDLLWLLVPKATIHADPSVLPEEGEMRQAAEDAMLDCVEGAR